MAAVILCSMACRCSGSVASRHRARSSCARKSALSARSHCMRDPGGGGNSARPLGIEKRDGDSPSKAAPACASCDATAATSLSRGCFLKAANATLTSSRMSGGGVLAAPDGAGGSGSAVPATLASGSTGAAAGTSPLLDPSSLWDDASATGGRAESPERPSRTSAGISSPAATSPLCSTAASPASEPIAACAAAPPSSARPVS
mmetsp:Transcript_29263/g.93174  ORF Transcript_29263/g.93174 Transcript_29263/m.93174 type:complete len:203 (-) Transcript_29263:2022-2630(-)